MADEHPNYAGNIIVNLSNLPDFLRKPILRKRLQEFFSMEQDDRIDVINNALDGGYTIPFANFEKLFKTWLEILGEFSEQQRRAMFEAYLNVILDDPQKILPYNLDGILGVFLELDWQKKSTVASTVKYIFDNSLTDQQKRKLLLLMPTRAKTEFSLKEGTDS